MAKFRNYTTVQGKPAVPEIELLTCCRTTVCGNWWLPDLRAPFWRLYRNHDNLAKLVHRGKNITLQRDRLYLIAPETVGYGQQKEDFDHLFIHFIAGHPYDNCRDFIIEIPEDRHSRHAVAVISATLRRNVFSPPAAMAALQLCATALTALPESLVPPIAADHRLQPVLEMIKAHPERTYANAELAELAGMSVNTLLRHFREQCGRSPQQYLIEARLQRACVMLQHSALSMEEVAEQTGFCDRFYFTRMFTRYRKISPAEFRKLNSQSTPQ